MARYILIRNEETGEEVVVDTYLARYRRLAQGYLNICRIEHRFLKHIILTQREENYKPSILDGFFRKMRRFYGDIRYVWVVEAQKRGVLHWHIVIGFKYGVDFGREDVLRIQRYWKYGMVQIRPVYRPSLGYLLKYITKSLGVQFSGMRRIGSSFISGWLRQSFSLCLKVLNYFGLVQANPDDFYWSKGSAYLLDDSNHRVWVYHKPDTGWRFVGVVNYGLL